MDARRLAAIVTLAGALAAAPLEAREPIEELPCEETEFANIAAVDCDFVETFLDMDFEEIAGCELDRLRVARHPSGWVVRARWRQCDTSSLVLDEGRSPPRRLRVRLELDPQCILLSGVVRGRGLRQPVNLMSLPAVEERCEALLDEDDGSDDDDDFDDDDFDEDEDDLDEDDVDEEAAAPAGTR
jgi:hypothetical protein